SPRHRRFRSRYILNDEQLNAVECLRPGSDYRRTGAEKTLVLILPHSASSYREKASPENHADRVC
ncbi:MAG TPA: hypothetical protein VEG65_06075, partial [Candidatus Bathyarchaeia archaeon]|nr:hypothetical protein [Candidatus Bathyarchaeia archaeon]